MYDFEFLTLAYHKVGFKIPLLWISYYKTPFYHLSSTVSNLHLVTLLVTDFYILKRCASLQFQKFESFISFQTQTEYGYELGEDYHNRICELYLIQISQESSHNTGFLEKYTQNISLWNLTQRAYQIPAISVSETYRKRYYAQCDLAILPPPKSLYVHPCRNKNPFSKSLTDKKHV